MARSEGQWRIVLVMRLSTPLYRKVQEKLDAVTGSVRENLTGVRVLRAFSREEAETANVLGGR